MSEQQSGQPSDAWGQPIGEERQADLQTLADQQREWAAKSEQERGESDFRGVRLTGADVFWLATYALAGPSGELGAAGERLRVERILSLPDLLLEEADLGEAHLEGAALRNAWMDKATALNGAFLDHAVLDQVSFDGTNLAVVSWDTVRRLGDEARVRAAKSETGRRLSRTERLADYEAAVRAKSNAPRRAIGANWGRGCSCG